jgi:hypothetical protein
MAGLGLSDQKVPHAATMPIVTAVVCFLSTQNMGS